MSLMAHLIPAEEYIDGRASERRRILFDTRIASTSGAQSVLLHNISETGLLIESTTELALYEAIDIELPQAGNRQAKVVWRNGQLYGCRFDQTLSSGAISAAQLRSRLGLTDSIDADALNQRPRPEPAGGAKLPLRIRLLVIIVLALLSWALVALVVAVIVALVG